MRLLEIARDYMILHNLTHIYTNFVIVSCHFLLTAGSLRNIWDWLISYYWYYPIFYSISTTKLSQSFPPHCLLCADVIQELTQSATDSTDLIFWPKRLSHYSSGCGSSMQLLNLYEFNTAQPIHTHKCILNPFNKPTNYDFMQNISFLSTNWTFPLNL